MGDFVIDRADERVLGPEAAQDRQQGLSGAAVARRARRQAADQGRAFLDGLGRDDRQRIGLDLGDQGIAPRARRRSRTPRYIESVYGRGYRLLTPVRPIDGTGDRAPARKRRRAPKSRVPAGGGEGRPPVVLVSAFHDEAQSATARPGARPSCARKSCRACRDSARSSWSPTPARRKMRPRRAGTSAAIR